MIHIHLFTLLFFIGIILPTGTAWCQENEEFVLVKHEGFNFSL
jgi:hypothetical protein